jgi:hypothetical protein
MRLVGIARLIDHVEDRYALFQERRRIFCALDLLDRAMRQPG